MCVATLQWPKTRVPLVWSYNSSLGAVLQKAALKKLYKEASQDVFLIGRYAFARSWKALNKEETSLCLNFIFQFVSKYWQSCTVCSMEKLYSEYHSLRNVKLQGGFPGGSPGGFPGIAS